MVRTPEWSLWDLLPYANILASDRDRLLWHSSLFNNILIVPFTAIACLWTFTISCGELPVSVASFRVMATFGWFVYWAVKFGVSWRSAQVLFVALVGNFALFVMASVLMLKAFIADLNYKHSSCEGALKAYFITWFIFSHVLTWKLFITVRAIVRPEKLPPPTVLSINRSEGNDVSKHNATTNHSSASKPNAASKDSTSSKQSEGLKNKGKDTGKRKGGSRALFSTSYREATTEKQARNLDSGGDTIFTNATPTRLSGATNMAQCTALLNETQLSSMSGTEGQETTLARESTAVDSPAPPIVDSLSAHIVDDPADPGDAALENRLPKLSLPGK